MDGGEVILLLSEAGPGLAGRMMKEWGLGEMRVSYRSAVQGGKSFDAQTGMFWFVHNPSSTYAFTK